MMGTLGSRVLEAVAVVSLIAVLVVAFLDLSVVPAVGRSATTAPSGWSGGISVISQVTVVATIWIITPSPTPSR